MKHVLTDMQHDPSLLRVEPKEQVRIIKGWRDEQDRGIDAIKLQCRCRNYTGCFLIDDALGCPHLMTPADCETCLALGGEHGEAAQAFRAKICVPIIGHMTRRANGPQKPERQVLVALTVKHKTISEERFRAPDIQNALLASVTWATVKNSWEKAASFLKALVSLRPGRKLSIEDRDLREQGCFGMTLGGERIGPPCQMLKEKDGHSWCNACGCGDHRVAEVKRGRAGFGKLDFPDLECPLRKQGFSNAKPL